jgi:hypothetical protein
MRLRYRILFTVCLLLLTSISCTKDNNPKSPSNSLYAITGIAYYKTYYAGINDSLPLANTMVFIRKDSGALDTSNYYFSIPTDKNGNFSFYITDTSRAYEIFTTTTIKSSPSFSALYYGLLKTDSPFVINKIYPLTASIDQTLQNGIYFTTVDDNGQIVPGAKVILYSSSYIATADTTFTGKGSFSNLTTDSLGKGFASRLPAGNLYVNATITIDAKTTLKDTGTVVKVDTTGVIIKTLILK